MSTWLDNTISSSRSNVNGFVYNGYLYTFGGFNGSDMNSVAVIDPETLGYASGISVPSMPTRRYNVVPVEINGKFYVAGGRTYSPVTYYGILEVYDTISQTWQTKAPMSCGKTDAYGAAIDGKFYVVGGANASGNLNLLEVYDPATNIWTQKASCPTAVNAHRAVAFEGKMYIFGGRTSAYPNGTPEVYCYDPAKDTWERKADMPIPRFHVGATVLAGRVMVVGGTQTQGTSDQGMAVVEIYNPFDDTWIQDDPITDSSDSDTDPDGNDRFAIGTVGTSVITAYGWSNGWFYSHVRKLVETNRWLTVKVDKPAYNVGETILVSGYHNDVNGTTVTVSLSNGKSIWTTSAIVQNCMFSASLSAGEIFLGSCEVKAETSTAADSQIIIIKGGSPMIFTNLTLLDSYERAGGMFTAPAYAVDSDERLFLKGVIKLKSSADNGAPVAYISNEGVRTTVPLIVDCGDYRIAVDPRGYILAKVDDAAVSDGFVMSLDGIAVPLATESIISFSRASTAYKQDGSQVAASVPRFEAGRLDRR